jgi:hypothetical protein
MVENDENINYIIHLFIDLYNNTGKNDSLKYLGSKELFFFFLLDGIGISW